MHYVGYANYCKANGKEKVRFKKEIERIPHTFRLIAFYDAVR